MSRRPGLERAPPDTEQLLALLITWPTALLADALLLFCNDAPPEASPEVVDAVLAALARSSALPDQIRALAEYVNRLA